MLTLAVTSLLAEVVPADVARVAVGLVRAREGLLELRAGDI